MSERFINPKEYSEYWKVVSEREKTNDPADLYAIYRVEDAGEDGLNLTVAHGESFIRTVIPRLISKSNGKKIKILETGGGAGFHSDQIRAAFPTGVEVFTTGLKKKTALDIRKNPNKYLVPEEIKNVVKDFPNKLHKNDLKWRSILELTPGAEFHLIIENYGEYYYSQNYEFLKAALDKLMPGGELSVYPIIEGDFWEINKYLKSNSRQKYNIKLIDKNPTIGRAFDCLKIFKV